MEANNTFQGGMNSDLSKIYQPENTYRNALNFRPHSDTGESVGSVCNIRGNECSVVFPILRGVYKLQIKPHDEGNYIGVITITVNGQTTGNINIDLNTKVSDIAPSIIALSNCYNNPGAINPTFAVAYDEESIVIYQQPEYKTCDIDQSIEPNVVITTISGQPELLFVDANGIQYPWNTSYIPTQSGKLVVIGSTFINEHNYLFTCPEINPNKIGQIWELYYDELTKQDTLKLIYNGIIDLSIDYPIAPSAAIGRFELESLQRIYWTDFYNPVRSLNVKDVNAMVLTTNVLNLTPSLKLSVPTLTNVINGQAQNPLNTDRTYQCAYRLVKNNGSVTNYSMCSNIVYPIMFDTNTYNDVNQKFASIHGYVGSINKALEFTVSGIDTEFDLIEFVIVEREQPNEDLFFVYKFDTKSISGNETITTLFTNPDDKEEITLQEFLIENAAFTYCKTLESKDNRLFFGNVKDKLTEYLETYDTRTHRFSLNSTTGRYLKYEGDSQPQLLNISGPSSWQLNEKDDNIPCYNLGFDTTEDSRWRNDKYKLNSNIIGGTGPNISYSFGTKLLRTDKDYIYPATNAPGASLSGTNEDVNYPTPTSISPNVRGFRVPGNVSALTGMNPYTNNAPEQIYPSNNVASSMAFEYFSGTFKSYQHNEIYRFGIVFYAKTGAVSFVKHIGDIKFPDYSDPVDPAYAGRTTNDPNVTCPDFRSMFVYNGEAYNVLPYIVFDVQIPSELKDLIIGYEIVRVKREKKDRYIKGHGMLHPIRSNLPIPNPNPLISPYTSWKGHGADYIETFNYGGFATTNYNTHNFMFDAYTPITDGFNGQNPDLNVSVDKIRPTERYGYIHLALLNTHTASINFEEYHALYKYYNLISHYNFGAGFKLSKLDYLPTGGNNGTVYNYWIDPSSGNEWSSLGSPTIAGTLDSSIPGNVLSTSILGLTGPFNIGTFTNYRPLAIYYDHTRLKTQYGGRTYIARTENEYISTGSFYLIDNNTDISSPLRIYTFGGDIYHGIVDIHKSIRNWGLSTIPATSKKHSNMLFFPTQSVYNLELRDGWHVNRSLNSNTVKADLQEDFYYNYTYSYENTVKKYYPQPAFFNSSDEWNNRVYWSNVKINGETVDSWASIPGLNYYDVEGAYGGINALQILNNKMYFIQDRAFGYLYINPITTISGDNGLPVTLGKGDTVEKHEYLSIDAGSKHQWSVFRSASAITFIDVRHKKIYMFNGQSLMPISDIKGQKGFTNKVLHDNILVTDNPIKHNGILVTYDHFNNEFLYTFRNKYINRDNADPNLLDDEETKEAYTLVYSELTNNFTSFYSFTPYIYINNRNKLYSLPDIDSNTISIYMHNIGDYGTFYGTKYPSIITPIVNIHPFNTKIFDNLSWISESIKENVKYKDIINNFYNDPDDVAYLTDTVSKIRCYDEYQNTDWINLSYNPTGPITNLRRSEQGWNIQVPRNKVNYDINPINTTSIFDPNVLTKNSFGERIRDKYMVVDMYYDNTPNNKFILHNLKSSLRISDR